MGTLVLLVLAAYAAAMQATLPASDPAHSSLEARDRLHAAIHGGTLLAAFLTGWFLGWAEERNGPAYAATITVVVAFAMAFALVASRQLACSEGLVLLRHWTCG